MPVIVLCLQFLDPANDLVQLRHLFGQQGDVLEIALLDEVEHGVQGLDDVSIEPPNLLDTFSGRFLIDGQAVALVGHVG